MLPPSRPKPKNSARRNAPASECRTPACRFGAQAMSVSAGAPDNSVAGPSFPQGGSDGQGQFVAMAAQNGGPFGSNGGSL